MNLPTAGLIDDIFSGRFHEPTFVVRVLAKRFMTGSAGSARKARLNISDGNKETNSVMCSGNLDSRIASLSEGALIRVTKWSLSANPQTQQVGVFRMVNLYFFHSYIDIVSFKPKAVLIVLEFELSQQQRPAATQQQERRLQPIDPIRSTQLAHNQHQLPQQHPSSYQQYQQQPSHVFGQQHRQQNSIPINALNPYMSHWTIVARVVSKSELRRWSSANGEGTLFSVDLLDRNDDEIRGVFFKDEADRFYTQIQKGKVYSFHGGKLKESNKKYTSIPHNFSITFDKSTTITEYHGEEAYAIKDQVYNFMKIGNLQNLDDDTTVDILGVVLSVSDIVEIITSKNEPLQKRTLNVVDDSLQRHFEHNAVDITIFGDKANQFHVSNTPVVAFKGLKKSSFNHCCLTFKYDTDVVFNPPEGKDLWMWKEQELKTNGVVATNSLTHSIATSGKFDDIFSRKSITKMDEEHLGQVDAQYYTIKALISFINKDSQPYYLSCPDKHKLVERIDGNLHCEKCYKDFVSGINRYVISMSLSDEGGSHWFTVFDEAGREMLGVTADQFSQKNPDDRDNLLNKLIFQQYLFRIRSNSQTFNDVTSVKSMIVAIKKIEFIDECQQMLNAIKRYN